MTENENKIQKIFNSYFDEYLENEIFYFDKVLIENNKVFEINFENDNVQEYSLIFYLSMIKDNYHYILYYEEERYSENYLKKIQRHYLWLEEIIKEMIKERDRIIFFNDDYLEYYM